MDWSYVAGYFDGEGSVRFKAPPSRPDYVLIGLSWANTHLPSLEAIRDFIGCGIIQHRKLKAGYVHQGHQLNVQRLVDILRVGEEMLPRLIVKRDQVEAMLQYARVERKPISERWGVLSRLGVAEIERMYRDTGMTQENIAQHLGMHRGAVATFMSRNGIEGRRPGPRPRIVTDANP
jgi:hypothetical protein